MLTMKEEIREHFEGTGWDSLITECMNGEPEKTENGGQEWVYECPWHNDHDPSLRINPEKGVYHCPVCDSSGDAFDLWQEKKGVEFSVACGQIAERFGIGSGAVASSAGAGITLEGLAEAKGFSVSDLKGWDITETSHSGHPAVRIPYLGEKGEEIAYSLRIALDGRHRFHAPAGKPRELYGLNWLPVAKDQDRVIFVEGESDCWTCWIHDIPAIGIPGANNWKEEWSGQFQDISSVFVIKEPDQGGPPLARNLKESFGRRLRVVELPAKDANELYHQDREDFAERFEECLKSAYCPAIKRPPSLTLSDLNAMADVEWLYEEWIPVGALTLVVGETGVGKSWLACYFIACATGTLPWPDGVRGEKHKVCLLETESIRAEYGRRLARLGLREDGGLILPYPEGMDGGEWYTPRLPADLEELVEPFIEDGHPWVVVVDSLSGAHKLKENDSEMRSLLQALSRFAAKHEVPVIAAHHLNKNTGRYGSSLTLDRIRGSSTIAQFSRSVIGLEPPAEDGRVRVHSLKSTFTKKPQQFGFRISDEGLFEVCDPPEVRRSSLKVDSAAEFLREILTREGPLKAGDIIRLGDEEGYGESTLRRAQKVIHAESEGGKWKLPSLN